MIESYDINDYLKDDKELQKAVIQELLAEVETRDNLVEHFRKEAISWANIANEYQKDKTKLEKTLQEIKKYSTEMREIANDDIAYHYFGTVLSIITKAEEE